ncbi:stomatin-like [Culicoides brevitarsis]|uniref:stomatin-like n=1 Tax=Culicoides brevitarsis TaxID=469753 RepID=UPI00307C9084
MSQCVEKLLIGLAYLAFGITFPVSLIFCLKIVTEYERAVIFRLGRIREGQARGPGIFFILPCIDEYFCVDLRVISFDVPAQEILSKDAVTVNVDAVVYYRVQDPMKAIVEIKNADYATRLLAQTTLRNVLGTKDLTEILTERDQISQMLKSIIDEATDPWGVKVERVEIKDVSLPKNMQRAMAAEAEASREARANIIAAEGEKKASQNLREAAEIMMESPASMQLRYLQTLNYIAAEKNSTIVFPLPMDLIGILLFIIRSLKMASSTYDMKLSADSPFKKLSQIVKKM